MEILKQNNIAIHVDEIQTFGRTEELFAFQYFGLDDFVDVVTIGKLSQVCATLFKDDFNPRPGLVSQTFTGATAAFFAAKVIIRELQPRWIFRSERQDCSIPSAFRESPGRYPKAPSQIDSRSIRIWGYDSFHSA